MKNIIKFLATIFILNQSLASTPQEDFFKGTDSYDIKLVKQSIEAGADINAVNPTNNKTAIESLARTIQIYKIAPNKFVKNIALGGIPTILKGITGFCATIGLAIVLIGTLEASNPELCAGMLSPGQLYETYSTTTREQFCKLIDSRNRRSKLFKVTFDNVFIKLNKEDIINMAFNNSRENLYEAITTQGKSKLSKSLIPLAIAAAVGYVRHKVNSNLTKAVKISKFLRKNQNLVVTPKAQEILDILSL